MNELESLRRKINEVDEALLDLLTERAEVVQEIAEYKSKNDMPVYQPQREQELFLRMRKLAAERSLDPDYIESLFKIVIENSKSVQERLKNDRTA